MFELLIRTVSQGLQAFLPIAVALTWFRRAGEAEPMAGLRLGMAASIPVTLAATYAFQRTTRQSTWEAALAGVALLAAIWFARRVRSDVAPSKASGGSRGSMALRLAFAAGATIVIVRQTMEIGVALGAAIEHARAGSAGRDRRRRRTRARGGGRMDRPRASACLTSRSKPGPASLRSSSPRRPRCTCFTSPPNQDSFPGATSCTRRPSRTDPTALYGRYVSLAVFAASLIAALAVAVQARIPSRGGERRSPASATVYGVVVVAVLIVGGIEVMSVVGGEREARAAIPPAAPPREVAAMAASPHLLFRHTAVDPNYSRLSITPLDARAAADRAPAALTCDRVSFAAGHGLCLVADRGMFTTYKAVLLDATLQTIHSIKLAGSPTRTRVSPDGRVGAITVFDTGSEHRYEGSSFSTRTTILDMATGDELGDLESFATWRDGKRISAADFNFWGVTFARDSNVFYATLKTAGKTYLVRGDLGLRKLTVLRENVECPALSPDNRLIGFKKRVGKEPGPWRFHVLDLATLTDRPIDAETRSIDDQLEWLDDTHVLYGVPRADRPSSRDVWVAPIDGSGPARIFLSDAESPIVVR